MPPKRKAAAKKAAVKRQKVVPVTKDSKPATIQDAVEVLRAADKAQPSRRAKPDSELPGGDMYSVHEDFDCMLNQTNIGHNNNKFYVIQVLNAGKNYYAWNRWGRVGESGQNAMKGPLSVEDAIKEFKKKFSDKTKNKWENRETFNPVPGKYTLIEMSHESDDEDQDEVDAAAKVVAATNTDSKVLPSVLDKQTQALIKLIFDTDMFCEAMEKMEIDVKKMPLGKLSKGQIAKGFECLDELEGAFDSKKGAAELTRITSRFYTLIPHSFGRQVPPVINTQEKLQAKKDMLLVLGDIELAQSMQKDQEKKQVKSETIPNPLDSNYDLLNCDLSVLGHKSQEFKIIQQYLNATMGYYKLQLEEVWEVNRHGEDKLFKEHDKTDNRKLLWHGTNVAVVAAILKSGLRIMPHSGGRVGRGIYFASENGKSASYVGTAGKTGIMFLNEVVLGKEYHITQDDSSLRTAPKGYDCVIAKGRTEPDPKADKVIKLDGKDVVVPQGKPVQTKHKSTSFSQSEYLIYKESQNRIRYLLKLKFPY